MKITKQFQRENHQTCFRSKIQDCIGNVKFFPLFVKRHLLSEFGAHFFRGKFSHARCVLYWTRCNTVNPYVVICAPLQCQASCYTIYSSLKYILFTEKEDKKRKNIYSIITLSFHDANQFLWHGHITCTLKASEIFQVAVDNHCLQHGHITCTLKTSEIFKSPHYPLMVCALGSNA